MFVTFIRVDGVAVSLNANLARMVIGAEDLNGPTSIIAFGNEERVRVQGDHATVRNQLNAALSGN